MHARHVRCRTTRLDIWKAASGALTAAKWDDGDLATPQDTLNLAEFLGGDRIAETGNYFTDLDEADAAEDDEDDEDGDEEETTGGEDETEDP